jgi:hypothetical protein
VYDEYASFHDSARHSKFIASNDRMVVNNEVERAWNEIIVANIKVASHYYPEASEDKESHLTKAKHIHKRSILSSKGMLCIRTMNARVQSK